MQLIIQESSLEDSNCTNDNLRVCVSYSIPPFSFLDEVTVLRGHYAVDDLVSSSLYNKWPRIPTPGTTSPDTSEFVI